MANICRVKKNILLVGKSVLHAKVGFDKHLRKLLFITFHLVLFIFHLGILGDD